MTKSQMEPEDIKEAGPAAASTSHPESCLFARTPEGITIGVVTTAEPSPLALLAAGVAGLGARRARQEQAKP
jgi:MYXO-CTERM domain-containing protein